jgi:hypothetical protein
MRGAFHVLMKQDSCACLSKNHASMQIFFVQTPCDSISKGPLAQNPEIIAADLA